MFLEILPNMCFDLFYLDSKYDFLTLLDQFSPFWQYIKRWRAVKASTIKTSQKSYTLKP